MTYDEVSDLLRSVRSMKSQLVAMQAYIDEVRHSMLGVTAQQFDDVAVVHSPTNSTEERVFKYLERYKKWEERYDKLFEEMCFEEDKLCEMMKCLSPTEYEVILNLYLRGLPRLKVADIMNYTEDGIKSVRKRAIRKMSRM